MFVYDLSCAKKTSLPDISEWLTPRFDGLGNLLFDQYHHPHNFKTDFPEYVYTYDELLIMKNKLNSEKSALNTITSRNYNRITNCFRSHNLLKSPNGILCREYGAEIVSNSWLKMYELMTYLQKSLIKVNSSKNKKYNTCHFAESPGNFLLAINHYLKINYPKIEWNWLANSYRSLYLDGFKKSNYLDDQYGLIKQYKRKWMFGSDGDGDITSPSNIISFKQETLKYFKGNVHFVTSDVKYVPTQINYDEEENYNISAHLGQLLCALTILSPGGTMILKKFTFYESSSISLLFIMSTCFDKLLVVKPETSKPANSEVYLVGLGYKANLSELQINHLLNILNYIRNLNNEYGPPAIFKKNDIPISFVKKIIDMNRILCENQIIGLRYDINLYMKYRTTGINKIYKDFSKIRDEVAQNWIDKMQIQILNKNDRMLIQ